MLANMHILIISIVFVLLSTSPLSAKRKMHKVPRETPSIKTEEDAIKTIFCSLDPLSVSQHLAFYQLYPETSEGKGALATAWRLLGGSDEDRQVALVNLPATDIHGIIDLVTRPSFEISQKLTEEQLVLIETLGKDLSHKNLKGHALFSSQAALELSDEETDLARTLLLFQLEGDPEIRQKIRQYEAEIDLMALQIRSRLTPQATYEEKIREINRFIFLEMQFRFPPKSLHAADIDLYTFLPSVLDGRQGVCLGVSILYLSLAQRLDLPLEIITPPGHIYVRYNNGKKIINIETTARGIDTPSEMYLGINTRVLKKRPLKEVVGLAFMNEAAVCWSKAAYTKALPLYEKALLFMPNDPLLKMFFGFICLFNDRKALGMTLLKEVCAASPFEEEVSPETIPEDYLQGRIDIEGIKAVFLPVDETRTSIVAKQQELEKILKRYPRYRAGLLQLATTWLQLGRMKESKEVLDRYHKIDPTNATVEYYLAILSLERLDYMQSWHHFNLLSSLLKNREHAPPALMLLKQQLISVCPKPS